MRVKYKFLINVIMNVSFLLLAPGLAHAEKAHAGPHYYCTAVDQNYFPRVVNLIGSIHKNDFDNLGMIAVFDLGMTPQQVTLLKTMQRVSIHEVEKKNVDILKPFKSSPGGRMIRGWFAWKPVVIKQALDMFPYVIYLDSGTTILKPLETLFKHIRQNGYFFLDTGHNIEERITSPVKEKVLSQMSHAEQANMLDKKTMELDGGFQGLSCAVYDEYVIPMYNLAADLTLFMDDGSARLGFGAGRHDQILFSIYAHKLGYKFVPHGFIHLNVNVDNAIHIHWDPKEITEYTTIYRSRGDIKVKYYEKFIHYNR